MLTIKAINSINQIKKITNLLNNLGIEFNNIELYILAFVHRSIVNERPDFTPEHNERLEFLGDAVLELIITEALFKKFPKKSEGELTDIRSALVRGRNLALVAQKLNFKEYLLLGKGEEKMGGRDNDYILANTVEAFIGAIYLDLGLENAKNFILEHIFSKIDEILEKNLTKDYKTILQEYSQATYNITPSYKLLSEKGPDHNKIFEVGCYLKEKQIGIGTGRSKKKAQENAAEKSYLKLINNLGLPYESL